MQEIPGVGILKTWSSKTTPTNAANPSGYAAGCEWYYVPVNGPPTIYTNVGGNGMYVGNVKNTVANWIESDPGSNGMEQFGQETAAQFFSRGGMAYRTVLNAAGIAPSGAGVDKIVDVFTLPAGVFDQIGRTLEFGIFATVTTGSALNAQMKVIANPTNVITWPSNPVPNLGTSNANIAAKTDGTVTVTGGTTLFDTGATSFNTSSVAKGFILRGLFVALSTTAQESMVTSAYAAAVSTGCGPWVDQTLTATTAIVFVVTVNMQTTVADFAYNGMSVKAYN